MSEGAAAQPGEKTMRLRYAGACRTCGQELPARTLAVYERSTKTVRCVTCPLVPDTSSGELSGPSSDAVAVLSELPAVDAGTPVEFDPGQPGASAWREYERRRAKREAKVRTAHPHLGRMILALSSDPQSTRAWATGAVGEEKLGARLNDLVSSTVGVLHDRRIPRTKANIDHIVVCPSGVFVVDAKRYQGRPQLRVEGGILRPRVETLLVGRRNCTKLVDGVLKQVELVISALQADPALPDVSVHGRLCFVEADWPVIGGSFSTRGVEVLWPKKLVKQLQLPGLLAEPEIEQVHRSLAAAFPPSTRPTERSR
jgi:hypothetical protein